MRRAVVSSHPTPESLFRLVQPSIGVSTRASFTALVGSMPSVVLGRSRLARRQERSQRAWVNLGLPQPSGPGAGWEDLAVSASQYGDIGGDDSDVLIYTAARVKYSRELVRRAGYAW